MQNGMDMPTPTMGADLNDLLNELATIKASKQMLEKRKKAIDAHIKEEVFDCSCCRECKTETEDWSVEWREQTRRSYIPTEVQRLVPPTVFGTMVRCRMRQSIVRPFSPMTLMLSSEHR